MHSKKKSDSFISGMTELIKSTRVHRTLTALTAIMVPVAFAGFINKDIFILFSVCMLTYAAAGVQNAIKDKDYEVPLKAAKVFSGICLLGAAYLALQNMIVFITFAAWIILGLFYNTIARKMMFGDVTVLAITHHTLPTFSAALILGMPVSEAGALSAFMFVTFWFIIHLKNLKDANDDLVRGYKTITTERKDGTLLTKVLFEISVMLIFSAYFLFELSYVYLWAVLGVILLKAVILYLVDVEKHENALNVMRLMVIVFLGGMILDKTRDFLILGISGALAFAYLVFLAGDVVKMIMGGEADAAA